MDLFRRVVEADGRLLKVERSESPPHWLLTFDVGRIRVASRPAGAGLSVELLEPRADLPHDLAPADEDEPWWRLLGSPLAGVVPIPGEGAPGVRLQFRADGDAPRFVALVPSGAAVAVSLVTPAAS